MRKTNTQIKTERVGAAMDAAIVLKSLEDEVAPLLKQLTKIAVEDVESYNIKSAKTDALKQLGKAVEAKEKSLTDPLTKVIKDIRSLFAPFRNMVQAAENSAKTEMLQFVEKTERAKAKVLADLENGKIAKLATAVRKTEALEIKSDTSQIRKVWTLEIIDVGDIPREYLIPDEAKIKEAFKAGKKVTGCKWEQKNTIAI